MINRVIFREYDIRGIVPVELNEQSVKLLGFFFGLEVLKRTTKKDAYVAVGYDARTHSPELFRYLTRDLIKLVVKY